MLNATLYIVVGAVLIWLFTHQAPEVPDSSDEEVTFAVAKAEKDVDRAMSLPDDFSREGAILEIRQREARLRAAGFSVAADSFAMAAKRRLEYHGYIINE